MQRTEARAIFSPAISSLIHSSIQVLPLIVYLASNNLLLGASAYSFAKEGKQSE